MLNTNEHTDPTAGDQTVVGNGNPRASKTTRVGLAFLALGAILSAFRLLDSRPGTIDTSFLLVIGIFMILAGQEKKGRPNINARVAIAIIIFSSLSSEIGWVQDRPWVSIFFGPVFSGVAIACSLRCVYPGPVGKLLFGLPLLFAIPFLYCNDWTSCTTDSKTSDFPFHLAYILAPLFLTALLATWRAIVPDSIRGSTD